MNWDRFPFSKLFTLVCAAIPGFALIIVVAATQPTYLRDFEEAPFFGYFLKVALLVAIALATGMPLQAASQWLQKFFILRPILIATRKIDTEVEQQHFDKHNEMPWDSVAWQMLIRTSLGLSTDQISDKQDAAKMWKELWRTLDQYHFVEWEILQLSPGRSLSLSFSSAGAIFLIGLLVTAKWKFFAFVFPFEVGWLTLTWAAVNTSRKASRSLNVRQREQLLLLARIVVRKAAPSLEVR